MGQPRPIQPALLVVAAFSRHHEALVWGRERLVETYGPVALASAPFVFDQTAYYGATMGAGLRKQLLAFHGLIDPGRLADVKRHTNALEEALAAGGRYPEPRPLNLDPGYLVLGKFLLATTKDQAHRVYLRDGIFAEVTLHYRNGAYHPWPWTYADYRLPEVIEFLGRARAWYREQLAARPPSG